MRNEKKSARVVLEDEIRGMLTTYQSQFDNKGICYLLMESNPGSKDSIEMEWQPHTNFEFFFAENGFPDAYSCDLRGNALLQRYPITKKIEETSGRYKEALKEFLAISIAAQ